MSEPCDNQEEYPATDKERELEALRWKAWRRDLEEASRSGAEHAIRETFARMGVDSDNPAEMEQFREALRLASRMQKAFDRGFIYGLSFMVAAMGVAVAVAFGGRWFK